MQWFINYRQDSISPSDRGLAYGDGLFETIQAFPQGFKYLNDHFIRLTRGLRKLGMPFSEEQVAELQAFLTDCVLPLVDRCSVVKIIITRGEGGRGYLPLKACQHNVLIGLSSAPDYQNHQLKGVRLGVSEVPVNVNSFLAGVKHLNRLENVLAKQRLKDEHFEAVMINAHGHVVECIQSNIFWFKRGTLYTPSLNQSGVQGVYRSQIINNQSLYAAQISCFSLDELKHADEIFITNSLMGIVPVISLLGCFIPIGIHTRKLQHLMQNKDVHDVF